MQNPIWKYFPPFEVKVTVKEIHAFLETKEWFCQDIITQQVVSLAKDAEKTVYSIRNDRMKPDQLGLLLILNVLGRHLSSGQYHIYRGVLNAVGTDMLSMWTAVVQAMEDRGYYDNAKTKEDMKWIRDGIKKVG